MLWPILGAACLGVDRRGLRVVGRLGLGGAARQGEVHRRRRRLRDGPAKRARSVSRQDPCRARLLRCVRRGRCRRVRSLHQPDHRRVRRRHAARLGAARHPRPSAPSSSASRGNGDIPIFRSGRGRCQIRWRCRPSATSTFPFSIRPSPPNGRPRWAPISIPSPSAARRSAARATATSWRRPRAFSFAIRSVGSATASSP